MFPDRPFVDVDGETEDRDGEAAGAAPVRELLGELGALLAAQVIRDHHISGGK